MDSKFPNLQQLQIHWTKTDDTGCWYGAPGRNNLEPSECDRVLQELEAWTEILKSEPEVIHKLAVFANAAQGDVESGDQEVAVKPSFEGPAP